MNGLDTKQREMREIFQSYEWLLKSKLEELDYMIRKMQGEMATFGIFPAMQGEYLPEQFERLKREVVETAPQRMRDKR